MARFGQTYESLSFQRAFIANRVVKLQNSDKNISRVFSTYMLTFTESAILLSETILMHCLMCSSSLVRRQRCKTIRNARRTVHGAARDCYTGSLRRRCWCERISLMMPFTSELSWRDSRSSSKESKAPSCSIY